MITPCVLPLVPGYLSALSSVEAGRLGERGTARRVVLASVPFILGFTVVFVVLGAGAAAIGNAVSANAQTEIAGFVLVVLGLAFVGLLPVPERILAPGLLDRRAPARLGRAARRRVRRVRRAVHRHRARRGARARERHGHGAEGRRAPRRVRARPRRSRSSSPASRSRARCRRSAGCATATTVIQVVSGLTLVALGLLLFFHRDWWLHVALNRALEAVGLTSP